MGKRLTAAVVGGGIGGLAAAALTKAGIEALVYEQEPALGEVGAGVLIGPNSVRLLHRLGLAAAIDEVGGWVGEGWLSLSLRRASARGGSSRRTGSSRRQW